MVNTVSTLSDEQACKCAGEYEGRGMSVIKRSGVYMHVLNMGWTRYYGQFAGLMREGLDMVTG